MSAVEILVGGAGVVVTVLVIAGMILITPRGQVDVHAEGTDPQGSNLSPTRRRRRSPSTAPGARPSV
jgi:hypothetical protein